MIERSNVPEEYVSLPPMSTGDKIVAALVTVAFLLLTGAVWACIFVSVWAFTGWKP